jgi:ABC-2 type transport system permease protein
LKLFFLQFGAELRKMLARKRTYIGFGAFLVLEIVVYAIVEYKGIANVFQRIIQHQGESFDHYFSALTLGFFVLLPSLLLSSVFMTLVAGDVVAKESEDGNLRLVLARPISRLRLLTVKYISCLVFSVILMQFIVWSVLLMGIMLRGWGGGMFVFSVEEGMFMLFDAGEGLQRYAMAGGMLCLSMMGASSIAFFLSCFRIKPSAATITALAYLFVDSIVREMHLLDNEQFLITHYMTVWRMAFMESVPWVTIVRSYTVLAGISLTLFAVGAAVFQARDVKS